MVELIARLNARAGSQIDTGETDSKLWWNPMTLAPPAAPGCRDPGSPGPCVRARAPVAGFEAVRPDYQHQSALRVARRRDRSRSPEVIKAGSSGPVVAPMAGGIANTLPSGQGFAIPIATTTIHTQGAGADLGQEEGLDQGLRQGQDALVSTTTPVQRRSPKRSQGLLVAGSRLDRVQQRQPSA